MSVFWLAVAGSCLVWYSTVTIHVAIQGARDIRGMLERLGSSRGEGAGTDGRRGPS